MARPRHVAKSKYLLSGMLSSILHLEKQVLQADIVLLQLSVPTKATKVVKVA
jgi:hypothetical protein